MDTTIFESIESEVRSYSRSWPTVFDTARGSEIWDEDGKRYLDFFAGAGALNYGHNHPDLKAPLLEFLAGDHVVHSLDTMTVAKRRFLERFSEVVLEPRGLDYRVQFPGPTGTNTVEAALKLARKVTGRELVVGFTNAFHGMTLGSLSVTGNAMKRGGAGVPLVHATRMPYCNYLDEGASLDVFEAFLQDSGSGLDLPAGVIVETVQGEGGLNTASFTWLKRLSEICRAYDMVLIVDDVQMGVGRTGPFFSFEPAGITPDIVCLSKSLSGYGMPMALTLFRPELDQWEPGEHNGTFRGFTPGFVTATASLDFWADPCFQQVVEQRGDQLERGLVGLASRFVSHGTDVRGRGMARGLAFEDTDAAEQVAARCFEQGLLVETSGAQGEVLKLLPPINVSAEDVDEALDIIGNATEDVLEGRGALVGGVS
jgi:diaminobutyrate-2-oxoglutarate transaminase